MSVDKDVCAAYESSDWVCYLYIGMRLVHDVQQKLALQEHCSVDVCHVGKVLTSDLGQAEILNNRCAVWMHS